jgi:hypothetical protein
MRRIAPIIFCSIFLFALLSVPIYTSAQIQNVVEDDIGISVVPEVPGAFEQVTITLESYVTDLNRAYMSWQKNGKQDIYGYGKKQLSFTTGNVGESTIITVSIRTVTGEVIDHRIVVNPAEINLLWEGADAYTPPFYRGRALPTTEGLVRVVALPQIRQGGALLNAENYVFTWKRQDQVIQRSSGFNKNVFVFQKDYLNPNELIEVTAESNDTGSRARAQLAVQAFKPKILFYEKNPLTGVRFQESLKNGFSVGSSDKTVVAIPYFISPKNPLSQELTYAWKVNGEETPTSSLRNTLTIRKGTRPGTATLEVTITSLKKLFLEEKARLNINLQ